MFSLVTISHVDAEGSNQGCSGESVNLCASQTAISLCLLFHSINKEGSVDV